MGLQIIVDKHGLFPWDTDLTVDFANQSVKDVGIAHGGTHKAKRKAVSTNGTTY